MNLLTQLESQGVRLELRAGVLHAGPRSAMTEERRQIVMDNKAALIVLLGTAEEITCPGDECGETIRVVEDVGRCPKHRMTVRFKS